MHLTTLTQKKKKLNQHHNTRQENKQNSFLKKKKKEKRSEKKSHFIYWKPLSERQDYLIRKGMGPKASFNTILSHSLKKNIRICMLISFDY